MEMDKIMSIEAERIPTSLVGYNEVFGGLPVRLMVGYYGAQETGKTWVMHQFGCDTIKYYLKQVQMGLIKYPRNVMVLDLEGGIAEHFLTKMVPVWNARFDLDIGIENHRIDMRKWEEDPGPHIPLKTIFESDNKTKFVVIDTDDLERLLLIIGRPMELKYTSASEAKKKNIFKQKGSGKIVAVPKPAWAEYKRIWHTPIAGWIERFNIGTLIMDSLSQPVTVEFPSSAGQTRPGRSDTNFIILGQIQKLTKEFDLATMVSHHRTFDEAAVIKKKGKATGGKPVGHNFKEWGYFTQGSEGKDRRNIEAMRGYLLGEQRICGFRMDELGVSDV
jgi:hypothetical protein